MRPAQLKNKHEIYRDEINSLQIQLSRTQAGPGRAVKEQQEQNSRNHVQRINLISVFICSKKNQFHRSADSFEYLLSDEVCNLAEL